jgi:ketosteroid isomerase-like protein
MHRSLRALSLGALLLTAACAGAPRPAAAPATDVAAEILPIEMETAAAWNRADLDAHVAAYADSAVFMAPGPVVGRERTRASLERSFWREGKPLQQLRYEEVSLRPLGRDHALMTGRFVLYGGGRADRSGWFSLVWARTAEGWKIIHDHSS